MERLTKKEELAGHTVSYLTDEDCFDVWSVPKKFMGKGIEKLADYEDTGLEPEEIIALCDMDSRAKMAEMLKTEEYYGVSMKRLKELAKADCEGRCVSFPAKVGDKVWFIKSMWNYADSPIIATIKGIRTFTDFNHFVFLTSTDRNEIMRSFMAKDIGKTVFLTREEAEKALEEYNGQSQKWGGICNE